MIKEDCAKFSNNFSNFEELYNSNILIAGGTGFVGKWITEMLIYLNEEYKYNISIYLLARNIPQKNNYESVNYIKYIKSDIRNLKQIPQEINYIINAIGSPDSRDYLSFPIKTIDTIFNGTKNLLNSASYLPNLKKILHLSSNKVYGNNYSENPIPESGLINNKIESQDIYAQSKSASEALCNAYISELQLPITIVRPFSFIGPFQHLDKPWAINNFIRDALLGGKIRILGDESTVRSYMYGSDMAFYILTILSKGSVGEVYNLGSDNRISLLELALLIKEIFNNKPEIEIKRSRDNYLDVSFDVPDMRKTIMLVGDVKISLIKESLIKSINWYTKQIKLDKQ